MITLELEPTADVKYIFLDVEGYSRGRSVEAQTDIIVSLNKIVRAAVERAKVPSNQLIYLPTGDGICIAILNVREPFDQTLLIALEILKDLQHHNAGQTDEQRRFGVRIGLNENTDNRVIDVNGRPNIAGS